MNKLFLFIHIFSNFLLIIPKIYFGILIFRMKDKNCIIFLNNFPSTFSKNFFFLTANFFKEKLLFYDCIRFI